MGSMEGTPSFSQATWKGFLLLVPPPPPPGGWKSPLAIRRFQGILRCVKWAFNCMFLSSPGNLHRIK